MGTDQWSRIEELFHGTLALDVADRSNYLLHECSGDAVLLEKVKSLVAASEKTPAFIEKPDLTLWFRVISQDRVPVRLGQSIGHYRIIQELGKGGMGEVYLAEDENLQRQVALKFFDSDLAGNEWARKQLFDEARAAAKLDHNNICAVHEVKEVGDYTFIVMQYVRGETLEELLKQNSLDTNQVIKLAVQIASALSAAHKDGIIHRDIKPRNLIVTPEGQVKVLDFGLAKLVKHSASEQTNPALDQTSGTSIAAGTAAYMSPEQANGRSLDFRTDIFSFGIVFYQMLTGENPFLRATRDETINAIKEKQPLTLTKNKKPVSREIRQIVTTCLSKDREQRFSKTDDLVTALRTELAHIERLEPAAVLARRQRRRRHARSFSFVTLPLLLLLSFGGMYIRAKFTSHHSLAVLKLSNKTGDQDLDYIPNGLTDGLITKFSYFKRIETSAPTRFDSRAGEQQGVLKLGSELKVEAVLYGELVKEGGALLLRLRLLNTARGRLEWEQTYDAAKPDWSGLQNDITSRVISSLGLWLTGSERKLLDKRQTDSQEAFVAYNRGRFYLDLKRDRETLLTAVNYFDQAIELDPNFARAYAARADSRVFMMNVAFGPIPTKEALDKARFDAESAVRLDDSLAEAHNSLGKVGMWCEWKWEEAEAEFRRAIQLNYKYPQAHYDYSRLLALLGRYDEAIKESQIAVELDPYSPSARVNYARSLYYSRRFSEAEEYLRQLLNDNPKSLQYLATIAYVLASQGKYTEAVTMIERAHEQDALSTTAALGYFLGKAGRTEEALKTIEQLDHFARTGSVPVFEKAMVNLGMGKKDEVFRLLNESVETHFPNVVNLGIDPIYDELRSDPKFISLVQRIGLPHSSAAARQ